MTRWTVNVPDDLDRQVKSHLAKAGMDLSSYVSEAIRRRLLRDTVATIRQRHQDLGPQQAQALAEEAIDSTRANRP